MDPHGIDALAKFISAPRLAPYLGRYQNDQKYAMRLYMWNIELSKAFWGPLSLLEVMVRNSIHDTMRADRRDDWWMSPDVQLAPIEQGAHNQALRKLARTPLATSADDVVAATSFGFWVGLVGPGITRSKLHDYESKLWQPRLHGAFPNKGKVGRKQIYGDLTKIRKFRNRVAHHEPIFGMNHAHMRDLIVDTAALVDADAANYIQAAHQIDAAIDRMQPAVTSGFCTI